MLWIGSWELTDGAQHCPNFLQAQLQETKVLLASHIDKVCFLDSLLNEHGVCKVASLQELMEEEEHKLEFLPFSNTIY